MIACSVHQMTKMYGGNIILENSSFEIMEKERVGLVGRNGSGKTSLLKILSGEETADSGQIHWKKGTRVGFLQQLKEFGNKVTAAEVLKTAFSELLLLDEKMKELTRKMSNEITAHKLEKLVTDYGQLQDDFTRKGGYEIEASINKIVNGLNITDLLDIPFVNLSGGEQTKVGLAFVLLKAPDFLLLDEPTNHLDLAAVEWLSHFLQDYQGTVLVVSHDRHFLDEVVNKILDLEDGEIVSYVKNYSGYMKEKEERLLKEFHVYEEQQKKIKKMKEAIKRLRDWANRANPPNEGLHRRARNMERALERMESLERPVMNQKKMNLEMVSADRSGKDVIIVRNVSKRFGEKVLFEQVNINVFYQQRVAIVGGNGTGKSTLIKLILQELTPDQGEIKIGSNVRIGYLSQHVFADVKDERLIDVFRNVIKVTEGEARGILAQFLFFGHTVFRKISQLSGGERMRLRLAQLMHLNVNTLILDEPTNHLDIESLEVLEEVLSRFQGTILAVSHDRYFLNKLFEKVYWIESQKIYCFDGNYHYAKKKMDEVLFRKNERVSNKKRNDSNRRGSNEENSLDEKWEVQLEQIESRISELEQLLIETQDLAQLQQIYNEKVELEKRWEEIYRQAF
ncbi:ABC-F family ATP-binding cassette domain-containing protein [Robertmurraya sp. DFI.2.37]|uniref:ribosomal protection-like ABC-F family protein n=1 Tax=Robertmurraya sp. DFI.2.37 TaxID=3031819 RepID=UPI0012484D25|nr:ABC-F family ATP-binding cassette domain-containing protein [Robertmurraya sp. DFI.2.37]MDF1507537.1 ABC-F family ATP-binding cassette domain-containing protein [Robertmurraya sp. DFI.2.37]